MNSARCTAIRRAGLATIVTAFTLMLPPLGGSNSLTAKTAADGDLIAEFGDAGILRTTIPATGSMNLRPYGFAAEAIVPLLGASDYRRLLIQPTGAISNSASTAGRVAHLDGYLEAGGRYLSSGPGGLAPNLMKRFLANGQSDAAFADVISATAQSIPSLWAFDDSIAVYPDGRIAAGFAQSPLSSSIAQRSCIVRMLANGQLDRSFNGTGWVCVTDPRASANTSEMLVLSSNILLVSAIAANQYEETYSNVRILESGAIEPLNEPAACGNSYNNNVRQFAEGPSGEPYAYWVQMAISSRFDVLCAGWMRYASSWDPDASFALSGTNKTLGPYIAFSKSLSQTIYAARTISDSLGAEIFSRIQLSRYDHDGQTLDPTFGVSGSITLSLGTPGLTPPESSEAMALTSTFDGSLYVGGSYRNRAQGNDYLAFARVRGNPVDLRRYWLPIAAR